MFAAVGVAWSRADVAGWGGAVKRGLLATHPDKGHIGREAVTDDIQGSES